MSKLGASFNFNDNDIHRSFSNRKREGGTNSSATRSLNMNYPVNNREEERKLSMMESQFES